MQPTQLQFVRKLFSVQLSAVAAQTGFPLVLSQDDHYDGFYMGTNNSVWFAPIAPVSSPPHNFWPNSILADLAGIVNFRQFPNFEATLYVANGERWASFEFEGWSFSIRFEGKGESTCYLGSFEQLSPHIMSGDRAMLNEKFPKSFSWRTTPEMLTYTNRNDLGLLTSFAEKLMALA